MARTNAEQFTRIEHADHYRAHPNWHKLPTEVAAMATRNVVLTQHQHELVEAWVSSGRYQNASEVLREGLRLLERQSNEEDAKLAALRDASTSGWMDLAAGRYDDVAEDGLDDFIHQLGEREAGEHSDT